MHLQYVSLFHKFILTQKKLFILPNYYCKNDAFIILSEFYFVTFNPIITDGQFQAFQRFPSSKLVPSPDSKRFLVIVYYWKTVEKPEIGP
jgi:hypothetical protein